jgi:hypothetical protein
MSNANDQSSASAHETYLKISSPSFSLELEGHPSFVMQSYDMVREDILRRLMELMRPASGNDPARAPLAAVSEAAPAGAPVTSPAVPELPIPEPPAARAPAFSFRDAPSLSARPNNMRDIKARMASKQPVRASASSLAAIQGAADAQSVQLNTQASILVELPPAAPVTPPHADPAAPSAPLPPAVPVVARAHYIWIYISHSAYNKVYVADLQALSQSPLQAFMDGRRLKKIHIENMDLPAFKALFGEGRTLWTEPPSPRL